ESAVNGFDAVPEQILKADDKRKGEPARASFIDDFKNGDGTAIFLERLGHDVAISVDGKVTGSPTLDVVGGVCRLQVLIVFRHLINTVITFNRTVIEVHDRAVLPISGGGAVFIGNSAQVFILYVDQTVASAITMFMREMSKERPLTHDLMAHLMTAVGAHVERVIINDLKNATYYARMIIAAENELQQKKIIELDARPSDCIAMATQQKAPIYVSQEVWDEVEDMSDVLRKMEEEGLKPEIDPESEATEEE